MTLADPEGMIVVENHSEEQRSVTVVDDLGRGWRVSAKGWSFQWVMTNSLGAWIEGRSLRTGLTEAFYLGSNAHQLGVCPRTLQEGLSVDAMGKVWRMFSYHATPATAWSERGFRAFSKRLVVEAIPPEAVGQPVALGDCLTLQQDQNFCGRYLWVGKVLKSTGVILWDAPIPPEETNRTKRYKSATGLLWTLAWIEGSDPVVAEQGLRVYASCQESSGYLEIRLEPQLLQARGISTAVGALQEAGRVLDRISLREDADTVRKIDY